MFKLLISFKRVQIYDFLRKCPTPQSIKNPGEINRPDILRCVLLFIGVRLMNGTLEYKAAGRTFTKTYMDLGFKTLTVNIVESVENPLN